MEKKILVRKSKFERVAGILVIIIIIVSLIGVIYWNQNLRFPFIGGNDDEKIFYVTATMWEFQPGEIKVNKGDFVTIHFSSLDTHHGAFIEAWNKTVDLFPNQTVTVNFVADKAGSFEYYCTVYCGIGHTDMRALITVVDEDND